MTNAKSYRHILKDQRCIIPGRHFFEFTGPKSSKTRRASIAGQPLLMADLWDYNNGLELLSFTIITIEPGPRFREYHRRVPAILPDSDSVEAFMTGSVEEALATARKDSDDLLQVQPA